MPGPSNYSLKVSRLYTYRNSATAAWVCFGGDDGCNEIVEFWIKNDTLLLLTYCAQCFLRRKRVNAEYNRGQSILEEEGLPYQEQIAKDILLSENEARVLLLMES